MDKKIEDSVTDDLVIAKDTKSATVDSMPNGTVVIGNKAFDLEYVNNVANAEEINKEIVTGGAVYVKDYDGNWIDNVTGKIVDVSLVPNEVFI